MQKSTRCLSQPRVKSLCTVSPTVTPRRLCHGHAGIGEKENFLPRIGNAGEI